MFHIKYENKNSNLKFGCQIPKLNFGGRIRKNCRTHWTFSAFKTSISGTLQRFDYDQWPRENNKVDSNIENLFELLSVAKPIRVLVRTDMLTSWNQLNC